MTALSHKNAFGNWRLAFRRTFTGRGRATCAEYWWLQLLLVLVIIIGTGVDFLLFGENIGASDGYGFSGWLESFWEYPVSSAFEYLMLPMIVTNAVRRAHDANVSATITLLAILAGYISAYLPPSTDVIDGFFATGITARDYISLMFWLLMDNMLIVATNVFSLIVWIMLGTMTSKPGNKHGPHPSIVDYETTFS